MRMIKYCILAILLTPFSTQAAVVDVWMNPQSSGPLAIGDTVIVDIWASWDVNLSSGSVQLAFDANIVNVVSSTTYMGTFDESNGMPAGLGLLSPIGFQEPFGGVAAGTYRLASVAFEAVGEGVSALVLSDPGSYFFMWEEYDINNQFFPLFDTPGSSPVGSITVVPLPAAAWFMLSGIGLLAFRRRRTAS